ncbi:ABC transporter A family member 1 [Linum perenne]
MGASKRQLQAMLRKNWLLKIRHPFVTSVEILLPTVVMLLLIAIRTQVDTKIHPAQPYIRKDMLVEVGKGISPNFQQVLVSLVAEQEFLAFTPDTEATRLMINVLATKFPLMKQVSRIYQDELELETYIRSEHYGTCTKLINCSNPKIKGAVVFHHQGPQVFDYSIRLNHTWAFSGFPDINTIMDVNGPFLNDLELGVNIVPILQYSSSGFFTLQQVLDSFIIFVAQQSGSNMGDENLKLPSPLLKLPWTQFSPLKIRMAPFPTREYTDDEFQSIVKTVMGVLYLLGFLYPISRLISYSVHEKEQKIREGLYIMGLKDGPFHLSWFITYALQFAVSSGIITVCTMNSLFSYSDKSLVFVYFFSFGLSSIMLSFLISTFFTRAKTAVAVGVLAFLGAFFPYYTVNDPSVSMGVKVVASFLSPTAFALGSVNFADYERGHVGLRWTNMWRSSSGVNFMVCLLMIWLDALLYCAIGLYLDKVLPSENGRRLKWNFLFQKCYWGKRPNLKDNTDNLSTANNDQFSHERAKLLETDSLEPAVEAITLDMKQQELDNRCIQIRNLHKVYSTRKGSCCAVNSLQLSLYENQILALLGHNGAGKSTTISMLVGLLPPTSGDALVFGKNITTDMDEIRRGLGVCPQHDILFPELTVREHLELFATLKGVDDSFLDRSVTDMIDEVGLGDKVNTVVRALSGGMKRKLSLGIALIGNSKSTPTASEAANIVYRHIPSATCVSEVGSEICFKLPLASSLSFEGMFREIESCMSRSELISEDEHCHGIQDYGISVTTLEEVFLRVAGSDYDESETDSLKQMRNNQPESVVPTSNPTSRGIFNAKHLGDYKKIIGTVPGMIVRACSFMMTVLFSFLKFLVMQCCCCSIISRSTFWQHTKALFIKRAVSARRDRKTIVFQLLIPAIFLTLGLVFLKLKPHPDQQSVTLTTAYFNPLITGDGGGGPIPYSLHWPIAKEVAKHIKGGWIQEYQTSDYKFPDSERALSDAIDAAGPTLGPALLSMSEFLMSSFNQSYESRWANNVPVLMLYGAIVMDDQDIEGSVGYTILHNSSCQHSAPTFINLMNAALLRLATGDNNMTITTRNHPLPLTKSQHLQRQDLDAFSAAIIVSIAFAFIPASFAVAVVKEREVKAKYQQLISGVSVLSYWASTYIWDFVSFLFPLSLAMFLFYIFGLEQFIGKESVLSTILLFLGYGSAIASSTYCLTFFFSDHAMAQNVVLLVHFFTGLILMVLSFIMGVIKTTASANDVLKHFFRIAPGFCFSDGLASLALLRQGMKDKASYAVFDWNVTGASICYLFVESIAYFLLTLGLELLPFHKLSLVSVGHFWKRIRSQYNKSSSNREPLLKSPSDYARDSQDLDEDIDVKTERERVLSGSIDNAILYLCNLRKVYPGGKYGTKVAVDSLSFSVHAGECFGFLGTNGAGKTTTLSMLSGEESPTDGTAFVFGKDIRSNPKAVRNNIGYCPQFDALLELLTVREHLELYARIKGVADYRLDDVVMEKLVEFDLLKHADKPSFALSGGNKRKLSVAIAMIGDPPIVFLDEPSTGMDPIAKRFMWEVISRLSTRQGKTAVILTTHSMNEAQALCTRIGIMVGGRLRCLGTPQHLKTRFGNHLELEVKPTEVSSWDMQQLCQSIQEKLFDIPMQKRSLLDDLEVCIGASSASSSDATSAAEISLSQETMILIGCWLGNEERVKKLVSSSTADSNGVMDEQLTEQLIRDGGLPIPVFSEWWLAKEKFSAIDSFVLSSFPGATLERSNGISAKYQLPYQDDLSLADVFGHIEKNRKRLGIVEYSINQSTLESIFNHFAAEAAASS